MNILKLRKSEKCLDTAILPNVKVCLKLREMLLELVGLQAQSSAILINLVSNSVAELLPYCHR